MTQQQPPSQEQQAVYEKIADALFINVPDDWTQIDLRIIVESPDQPRLEIAGPDDAPLLRAPDDTLYPAVYHLIDLFKKSGQIFRAANYRLTWDESTEDWQMTVDYQW